jgi:hypothetical protein
MGLNDRPPAMSKGPISLPRTNSNPRVTVSNNTANPTNNTSLLNPPPPTPPLTIPSSDATELTEVQDIIRRTEKANSIVRKYNTAKKLLREDHRYKEPVLEDKEEEAMPDISAFIHTNPTPAIVVTSPTAPMLPHGPQLPGILPSLPHQAD